MQKTIMGSLLASLLASGGVGMAWAAGGAAIITGVILIGQGEDATSTTSTTGTN